MLLSNNGLNFTSQVVNELSALFGTCLTLAAPYYLANNGEVERAKSTLVFILQRMASFDPLNWPRYLESGLLAYYIKYNCVIGFSTFNELYERKPTIFLSALPIVDSLGPGSTEAGM